MYQPPRGMPPHGFHPRGMPPPHMGSGFHGVPNHGVPPPFGYPPPQFAPPQFAPPPLFSSPFPVNGQNPNSFIQPVQQQPRGPPPLMGANQNNHNPSAVIETYSSAPSIIHHNLAFPPHALPESITNVLTKPVGNDVNSWEAYALSKVAPSSGFAIFIGRFTSTLDNPLVNTIVQIFGTVHKVTRSRDHSGNCRNFLFVEYVTAKCALQAARVLNGLDIGGRNLIVTIDSNTQIFLNEMAKFVREQEKRKKKESEAAAKAVAKAEAEAKAETEEGGMEVENNEEEGEAIEEEEEAEEEIKNATFNDYLTPEIIADDANVLARVKGAFKKMEMEIDDGTHEGWMKEVCKFRKIAAAKEDDINRREERRRRDLVRRITEKKDKETERAQMNAASSAADDIISSSYNSNSNNKNNEANNHNNNESELIEEDRSKRRKLERGGVPASNVNEKLASQIASRADTEADKKADKKAREREAALADFHLRMANLPTDAASLMEVEVDWSNVEMGYFISSTIRPWVSKKVKEYLGADETVMVEFIIDKITKKASPQELLQELQMVLEEDAEVVVCDLWRLIINYSERIKIH